MTRGWRVVAMLWSGALAAGAFTAHASEPAAPAPADNCDFKLECQLGAHAFSVGFDSESGECVEDDMRAFVETSGGKVELPLEKAWYRSISNLADGESICHLTGARGPDSAVSAFAVDEHRALVFFTQDGRPGYDSVGVVLIDTATGKVLDVKQRLGQSKDSMVAILKTPRGYKLQLVRESLSVVRCDCSAAFADDWMSIEVVNGRIRARWMR
ncbi:hypothetical protein [Pyxidicoccus sp. MSG2]|uniref:hypothetical protein n=1 Tax=Pyxidicoccus sp. MSG2 TaxID=2996790 RepID=UPI00226DBE5E|nr:hypothetical protein [Pyxidicoccus sp. MSG2]MCY1017361.1 hypothetical protein [Pyxidicoccus sp. MSG2]